MTWHGTHIDGTPTLAPFVGGRLRRGRVRVTIAIHNSTGTDRKYMLHDGIKGRATRTLDPQEVPLAAVRFRFTVIAHDIHNTLQIRWHGVFGDITCPGFPRSCHGLLAHNRLFANGATVVEACKLSKAVGMDGMSARQILGRLATAEHIFTADWAVVFILVLEALVRLEDRDGDAHAAFVTMAEGFHATYTAESALYTVKRFLGLQRMTIQQLAKIPCMSQARQSFFRSNATYH